jgi:hypothetical protein
VAEKVRVISAASTTACLPSKTAGWAFIGNLYCREARRPEARLRFVGKQ